MTLSEIINLLFGSGGSQEQQSSSPSITNPISHQSSLNQANPQFNTYYYQPSNITQHSPVQNNPTTPSQPQYCHPGYTAPCANPGLPNPGSNAPYPLAAQPSPPEDQTSIVQWVPSTPKKCSELEGRAVVGGYSIYGADLWVIRTIFESELLPAALNYGTKDAFVAYQNDEYQIYVFEVCCVPVNRVRWVEASNGNVPPNAVVGGRTKSGEKLYVGRAPHDKCLSPGKVQPSHGVLYLSFGYKAYAYSFYEVMCIV